MICRNCNSQLQEGTVVCPYCGFNHSGQQNKVYGNIQQNNQGSVFENQNYGQYNQQFNGYQEQYPMQRKKKNKGCLIAIIVALILIACFVSMIIVGGIVIKNLINTAVDNISTEMVVETENGNVDTSGVMKDLNIIVDGFKEIGKTLETYEFPDLDGDGKPDVEILDGDNFVVDLAYLGEFIADTFEIASQVQVADGTNRKLYNDTNTVPTVESLTKILKDKDKSIDALNLTREEYGLYECYDSKELEKVKDIVLEDIGNEIILLEEYEKVLGQLQNGDTSGIENLYKAEELYKQKDLDLGEILDVLVKLGESYGIDLDDIADYIKQNNQN